LTPYYVPPPLSVALREVHGASAYACIGYIYPRTIAIRIRSIRTDRCEVHHFDRGGTAISLNARRTVNKKWSNREVSPPTAV